MKIFEHTYKEPKMWRGWLKNGQSVEISWGKCGWEFGGGVHIHTNDMDFGDRMLFLKFWRLTVVLPLGIIKQEYDINNEPQWSVYASQEFGLTFHWRKLYKSFDWPWHRHVLDYQEQLADGSWRTVKCSFEREPGEDAPYKETHSYTYTLRNGTVQNRYATVSKRRFILTWRAFKRLGWPKWIEESIEIEFDGEVGERTGSWKGGTIGCDYNLKPGETIEQCLRRMEREREFR